MTRNGATGYAIKHAFERGFRYIWDAELIQIYPALQRLEKQGLLSSEVSPGERGSSRVYTLTKKGEQQLSDWLRADPVFHASAFVAPLAGEFGNIIRGPGINNWDMGISKVFSITERVGRGG